MFRENILGTIFEHSLAPRKASSIFLKKFLKSNQKLLYFYLGTDTTLLMKLNANHGSKSIFVRPFSDHAVSFGIRHFAGVVMYYSKGKNF